MKRCIVGVLAAVLMAAELIASAPPASAGCQYGPGMQKCDEPIQPDGTWQRCVVSVTLMPSGASSYLYPKRSCDLMGPDRHPWDLAFADPPTHIDD